MLFIDKGIKKIRQELTGYKYSIFSKSANGKIDARINKVFLLKERMDNIEKVKSFVKSKVPIKHQHYGSTI